MLTKTPAIGDVLVYTDKRKGLYNITVRVVKVYAAVCEVEIIVPIGLQTEASFARIKTHDVFLSERVK